MASIALRIRLSRHLLDLNLVDEHQIVPRIESEPHPDALVLGADQRERARFLHQLGEAFDPALGLAARDEIAQPVDDLSGAQRLLGCLVERFRITGERSWARIASRRREPLR